MTPQRVTLITLGVADLARARAFYAALGWIPHATSQDGVAFYQMHGAVLSLFGRDDLAEDQGRPGAPLGTGRRARCSGVGIPAISPTRTAMSGNWR